MLLRLLRRHPALREVLTTAGGLLLYFLARGRIEDRHAAAQRNAHRIIRWEERLGLCWEPALNRWTAGSRRLTRLWNLVYFWGHAPLIAVSAVWLYRRHRPVYGVTRAAFALSAMLGLISYRLFPVAPPRLTEGHSFIDTMQEHSKVSYQAQSLSPFVNPYAAVPSLHFGWSFLLSAALVLAAPRRAWAWAVAIVQPVLMFVAIVATANHWVLDAVAGLAVCLAGLGGALAQARWRPHTAAPRNNDV